MADSRSLFPQAFNKDQRSSVVDAAAPISMTNTLGSAPLASASGPTPAAGTASSAYFSFGLGSATSYFSSAVASGIAAGANIMSSVPGVQTAANAMTSAPVQAVTGMFNAASQLFAPTSAEPPPSPPVSRQRMVVPIEERPATSKSYERMPLSDVILGLQEDSFQDLRGYYTRYLQKLYNEELPKALIVLNQYLDDIATANGCLAPTDITTAKSKNDYVSDQSIDNSFNSMFMVIREMKKHQSDPHDENLLDDSEVEVVTSILEVFYAYERQSNQIRNYVKAIKEIKFTKSNEVYGLALEREAAAKQELLEPLAEIESLQKKLKALDSSNITTNYWTVANYNTGLQTYLVKFKANSQEKRENIAASFRQQLSKLNEFDQQLNEIAIDTTVADKVTYLLNLIDPNGSRSEKSVKLPADLRAEVREFLQEYQSIDTSWYATVGRITEARKQFANNIMQENIRYRSRLGELASTNQRMKVPTPVTINTIDNFDAYNHVNDVVEKVNKRIERIDNLISTVEASIKDVNEFIKSNPFDEQWKTINAIYERICATEIQLESLLLASGEADFIRRMTNITNERVITARNKETTLESEVVACGFTAQSYYDLLDQLQKQRQSLLNSLGKWQPTQVIQSLNQACVELNAQATISLNNMAAKENELVTNLLTEIEEWRAPECYLEYVKEHNVYIPVNLKRDHDTDNRRIDGLRQWLTEEDNKIKRETEYAQRHVIRRNWSGVGKVFGISLASGVLAGVAVGLVLGFCFAIPTFGLSVLFSTLVCAGICGALFSMVGVGGYAAYLLHKDNREKINEILTSRLNATAHRAATGVEARIASVENHNARLVPPSKPASTAQVLENSKEEPLATRVRKSKYQNDERTTKVPSKQPVGMSLLSMHANGFDATQVSSAAAAAAPPSALEKAACRGAPQDDTVTKLRGGAPSPSRNGMWGSASIISTTTPVLPPTTPAMSIPQQPNLNILNLAVSV